MTKTNKTLAKMRNNPRDWRMEDFLSVAKQFGLQESHAGGSHYKFSHPSVAWIVTIPAHRPIKPVYTKQFLALIDAIDED